MQSISLFDFNPLAYSRSFSPIHGLCVIQGVQEKLCFFTIHSDPSLAYIAVGDLQSSQRNASVQSLLLAVNFLYDQLQPIAGQEEVANFREFLEKHKIFNEHPVCNNVSF